MNSFLKFDGNDSIPGTNYLLVMNEVMYQPIAFPGTNKK
jgi:hypothetical protein